MPNVDHDIFVSYKHVGDGGDPWMDEFCELLRLELLRRLGQVSLFRDSADRNLIVGDRWRDRLMHAVETAPVFLAILSDPYFSSKECMEELSAFLERMQTAGSAPNGRKLFPVLRLPVENDLLARDLNVFQQQRFFERPPDGQPARELSPEEARQRRGRFYEAIVGLADALRLALREARGEHVGHMAPAYLGTIGAEDDAHHDHLALYLRSLGWMPLPENPYLWPSAKLRDDIRSNLERARLAVFPIPVHLDARGQQRLTEQIEAAVEVARSRRGPKPMVWIAPGETGEQGLRLRIRDELAGGIELFDRCGISDFKGELQALLQALHPQAATTPEAAPRPGVPAPVRATGRVAVLMRESDVEAAVPLLDCLVDGLDCDPNPVPLADGAALAAQAELLQNCEACVIVWAGADAQWVQRLIDDAALAALRERGALAVLPLPPLDAMKRTLRRRNLTRLPDEGLLPALRDFIDHARGAA